MESREEIAFFDGVEIVSLPGEWKFYKAAPGRDGDNFSYGNEGCYKIDVKGRVFGADWNGRIVIYADEAFNPGDVVEARVMRASHTVAARYTERATLKHGTVTARELLPIQAASEESFAGEAALHTEAGFFAGETHREIQHYEYVVLARTNTPATKRMEWITAYSKVTLKGLGNQYASKVDGAPLWHKEISGGVRSGRIRTTAWLAVTDAEHPAMVAEDDAEEFRKSVLQSTLEKLQGLSEPNEGMYEEYEEYES